MKEHLATLLQPNASALKRRNLAREYLQALILQSLQRSGAMTSLAFHGGTALRFLYSLLRYSDDLDFALETNKSRYDFRAYLQALQKDLEAQGYKVALKVSDRKTVHSAYIRFPGLLYELNLSSHRDEVLAVKIEVDTDPPKKAGLETSLVRHHVLLNLQHHDKSSLLAGKLHAILQRPYPKGRDIYDLIWYLGDRTWPNPNIKMLNNALAQTDWTGPTLTVANWRSVTLTRIKSFSWDHLINDVQPFLQTEQEIELLTKDNLTNLLQSL
ncbi:MAG: nucleotidyl transferase AbiEii/AbiGii toxin family protein [Anaerolineales bacterium]|nr:nucleotidyl transferase AbiEii/AbiGii toxin family protein [Anaerolineales bacterium]